MRREKKEGTDRGLRFVENISRHYDGVFYKISVCHRGSP